MGKRISTQTTFLNSCFYPVEISYIYMYNMETMKVSLRAIFILCISILLIFTTGTASAQSENPDGQYFAETGHWVSGAFLEYYQSADEPLLLFGYPITDDFIDPVTNHHVQYFQKARFDLTMTPDGVGIESAPLGELLYVADAPEADLAKDSPTCRTFPSTGKTVCYAFLQFYEANQGWQFLGQPISNTELRDNHFVQYFQNARLEWRADLPAGSRVLVTDLGRYYFDEFVGNIELLTARPANNMPDEQLKPQVRVFVAQAIVPANSKQTIYVVAQDQFLRPLKKAMVAVNITLPDGSSSFFRLPETDENGVSRLDIAVGNLNPREIVKIVAQVSTGDTLTKGAVWFRIWW